MKYTNFFIASVAITLLASCAGNRKQVLVLGHSNTTVNTSDKKIISKEESGHDEKTVQFGGGKIDISITSSLGEKSVSLTEKGAYILNAKHNDTIIGSFQNYGTGNAGTVENPTVISQDEIKRKIDSLEQLIQAKNVSTVNRNFFIKPFEAVRVSENPDAVIVAPFHQMSKVESKDGKYPEVYRFYTINEIRGIIAKLKETTK